MSIGVSAANDVEWVMSDNKVETDKSEQMDLVQWLTDEQLDSIYTSEYWNDIEAEKLKECLYKPN